MWKKKLWWWWWSLRSLRLVQLFSFGIFFFDCALHTIYTAIRFIPCLFISLFVTLSLSFSVCFLLIVSQTSIKHTLNKTDSEGRDRETNTTQYYQKYTTKIEIFLNERKELNTMTASEWARCKCGCVYAHCTTSATTIKSQYTLKTPSMYPIAVLHT